MVRALIIGEVEKAAIEALKAKAAEHVLDAEAMTKMDPAVVRDRMHAYTIDLPHGFSVTYTHERQPIGTCAHLSVSVDAKGKGPHPAAVDMILEAFGMDPLTARTSLGAWKEDFAPGEFAINVVQRAGG